jgi:sporulation protein YlmC with PRC-barrel domain
MLNQITKSILAATALSVALPGAVLAQEAGDAQVEAEIIALPEWSYDELYADGVSVDDLLEADVVGPTGEEIGAVENVIFDAEGGVLSIIAEIGGFLEIGDTHINVPWDRVEVGAEGDNVVVPVTQETVEEYSLFADPIITAFEASEDIEAVEGDNAGVALTGPRAWRATELIDDYARLRDGDGFANYGYVDDLVIRNDELAAVVVRPDVGWGAPGLYAYPYYGYGYGWYPGLAYYDLPYDREAVGAIEPFEEEELDD